MDINNILRFGMSIFDGNGDFTTGCYFRETKTTDEAPLVLVSAPWAVTSAGGHGSVYAPDAIIDSSNRVGLYDAVAEISIEGEVATAPINYDLQELSQQLGNDAAKILTHVEDGGSLSSDYFVDKIRRVNNGFLEMHAAIEEQVSRYIEQGKIVGTIGGDHSTSFGAIRAAARHYKDLGILFVDAHCDLRQKGSIFDYSHHSVARNIIEEIPQVSRLVEVGVRDISANDIKYIAECDRIKLFCADTMAAERFAGRSWSDVCDEVVEQLPELVYISFDIDALSPECCPHTKQPVAGGLNFDMAVCLINRVTQSGRRIVGFDLTEIVPVSESNVDANVGARLLTKLCATSLKSNKIKE
ncbi:MAG: arginase family protein [Alistipes sp.]|nr:arginase family protein [Alistipes sp.]